MNLPNWLTVSRVVMCPIIVILYYIGFPGWNYWAAAAFIIGSVTDLLDGMIARRKGLISNFGKLMDPMADKMLVTAAILVLMEWDRLPMWVVMVLIAREFIISAIRLVAVKDGNVIAAGIWGKLKTVFQMVGLSLLLLENPLFSLIGIPMGEIVVYISVALSVWSCIDYIYKSRKYFTF